MTITVDAANNVYLGDCQFANYSMIFPTINYLKTNTTQDDGGTEFPNWLTQNATTNSGFTVNSSANQTQWNSFVVPTNSNGTCLALFRFSDDPTATAKRVAIGYLNNPNTWLGGVSFYNDSGSSSAINTGLNTNTWGTNRLFGVSDTQVNAGSSSIVNTAISWKNPTSRYTDKVVCGVANGTSINYFFYQKDLQTEDVFSLFVHASSMSSLNTNLSYYNSSYFHKLVGFCIINNNGVFTRAGGHYLTSVAKQVLETDGTSHLDASYTSTCNSGSPTAKWARRFPIFDNNINFGYPMIGFAQNVLIATGSYIIGQPIKINGATQPDGGNNTWLPVGKWGNTNTYTLLMRCYSSGLT